MAASVAVAVVLAGCSADEPDRALPGAGGSGPVATTGSAPADPTATATPGPGLLIRGPVTLTVRPQDAGRRPVLDSYLRFFAAYAVALEKADPRSADLRRFSTPAAFADFSRSLAENARAGITVRGPVTLQPAVRSAAAGALTVVLVDCLDATGQRSFDRSGRRTGGPGERRPIQVELVDTPGPVRWVVGSVADGPADACEKGSS